ncbi:MAG: tetratricopeptide repeat protein [Candidatus Dadabacteria bacterium]|nr:tetratricopeptide repeat protein [Candidatus Dadabacteria bacterium]
MNKFTKTPKSLFILTLLIVFISPSITMGTEIQFASKNKDSVYDLYKSARKQFLKFTPQGFNQSIASYQEILDSDPGFAPAYSGLSEVYSFLGNYKFLIREDYEDYYIKSYKNLKKALKLSPASLETQRALATHYLHLRWLTRAKKKADSIISQHPSSPEAYYVYWSSTGKNPDSPYIKKSLELNPNYIPAHIELGTSYFYKKRDYKKAAEHYTKSLEIADSPQLRDFLGTTLRTQGRFTNAIEQYEQAIQMDKNFALAYMNIGITKYYMRKYDEAISYLDKAVAININHPESFFFLGSSHEHANNKNKALENYKKFLRLSLNDHRYREYVQQAKNSYNKLSN